MERSIAGGQGLKNSARENMLIRASMSSIVSTLYRTFLEGMMPNCIVQQYR